MFRLYVFTCCLQRIFYNRKKIPFPRFFFAGWKKSHLLEFFCWCKGKNPIFRAHRGYHLAVHAFLFPQSPSSVFVVSYVTLIVLLVWSISMDLVSFHIENS